MGTGTRPPIKLETLVLPRKGRTGSVPIQDFKLDVNLGTFDENRSEE